MASEPPSPPRARRLGTMLWSAAGWMLTAIGVVAILVLAGDASVGGATRTVIAVAAVLAVATPAAVGVAYRLVRARNRRMESRAGSSPLSDRAVRAQSLLGSAALRLGADRTVDVGPTVLSDHVRISESTVRGVDPTEILGFLWVTRPSQPEDFPRSPEFAGLPEAIQDVIVLLDLRREVELRGAAAARAATSGFYHHDAERTAAAVRRSGNPRLRAEFFARTPRTETLLAALDDPTTWDGALHA